MSRRLYRNWCLDDAQPGAAVERFPALRSDTVWPERRCAWHFDPAGDAAAQVAVPLAGLGCGINTETVTI